MGATSLLEINIKEIISKAKALTGVNLPADITEASLLPKENLLHIRFSEPEGAELGEPLHPLVHVFKDKLSGTITAMEIIDVRKFRAVKPSKASV